MSAATRVARRLGLFARTSVLVAMVLTVAMPASAPMSYVEESPSPSPSPTATATPSATPSPTPTQTARSEPLPPPEDDYWDEIDDPEYEPPSPTPSPSPTARSTPRQTTERVPAQPRDEPGRMEIEAGSGEGGPDGQGGGRPPGFSSRDAYPPGTFDGGYGLFTPRIEEAPITARPDDAPTVPPSGSRSTEPVMRRLREAEAALDQVARTLAPFPVAGLASYAADWQPPATAPGIQAGDGAAVMADEGTPVVASANGPVQRISPDPAWGTTLELTGPDGTRYRYGRLLRVAPAIQDGMEVARGQIIGFVGSTGTIPGGAYVWFQLLDRDGAVVAPFVHLDRWLEEALITARVTTGLPAVDAADQVAAGLITPEEAGIEIGPDGVPVSSDEALSPLETVLSLSFFAAIGWRLVAGWRKRRRKAEPVPEESDTGTPAPLSLGAEQSEPAASSSA